MYGHVSKHLNPSLSGLLSLVLILFAAAGAAAAGTVLVEAEAFEEFGGWVNDQQFMDLMGSPYLLAHGMGRPVQDATTTVALPQAGVYRVWVRTRDWVAPWNAPGAPGRFQVLVDGKPLGTTFGTEGEAWHWQDGGEFIADYTRGEGYTYQGPYWVPYRCLYSRNIENLFMAGRDISVTHEALGAVRVMKTTGAMGEIVGMAASLCKRFDCNPRDVYAKYLEELKQRMARGASRSSLEGGAPR